MGAGDAVAGVAKAGFDWGSAAGGAVGGLIGGGFNLLATHMQNKANEKMNKENLRLAYIQRGDTLAQQATENKFGELDRAYRDRMAAYQQRQDARAALRQRLQDDQSFRMNAIAALNAARRQG